MVCASVSSESGQTNSKADLLGTLNKDILLEETAEKLHDLHAVEVLM